MPLKGFNFRLVCLLSALIESNVYCEQTLNKLGCVIKICIIFVIILKRSSLLLDQNQSQNPCLDSDQDKHLNNHQKQV
jgi:hypothetical protein